MPLDARYDPLFQPLQIGPVTTKNRFYQVPHCNGAGYRDPSAAARMRGIKAEGGWGVVFTEQCEIHETSEITPFIEQRLWEDQDIPALAAMADAIHEHGALAGIQMAYSGINGPNLYTREVPLAVTLEELWDRLSFGSKRSALDPEHQHAFLRYHSGEQPLRCYGGSVLAHCRNCSRSVQRRDQVGGSSGCV